MASDRIQRQVERLLDEAESAVFAFDWEKVRQCAHVVIAIDPGNSDGLEFLATVERALSASSPNLTSSPYQADSTATGPTSFPVTAPEAERRQLTVSALPPTGAHVVSSRNFREVLIVVSLFFVAVVFNLNNRYPNVAVKVT